MATRRRIRFPEKNSSEPLIRQKPGTLIYIVVGKFEIDLSFIGELFPSKTSQSVGMALAKQFARLRKSSLPNRLQYLRNLVKFGVAQSYYAAFERECTEYMIGSAQTWQQFLHAWATSVKSGDGGITVKGHMISAMVTIVTRLSDYGVAPRVALPSAPRKWRRHVKSRKGVLEAAGGISALKDVLSNINRLIGGAGVTLNPDEIQDLEHIGSALSQGAPHSEDAIISAIASGTNKLLQGIRRVAEQRLTILMERKHAADEAVARWGNPRAVKLYDKLSKLKSRGTNHERHKILVELFPSDDVDVSNANWLLIIKAHFGGVAPAPGRKGLPTLYETEFLPSVGGIEGADELTSISVLGLAACCILYMVDSLGNVCTALELKKNCLQQTDDPRIARVVSLKPRAGFEPIVSDFLRHEEHVRVTVPQAIAYVQTQTEVVRKFFGGENKSLFVCAKTRMDGTRELYELHGRPLRNWLHLMMGGKRGETPLISPASIRVSGLTSKTLDAGGDVLTTQLHAHHQPGTGTSEHYARTYPVRLLYTKKIRQFTEFLQNKVVFSHMEMREAFGMTKAEALQVIEKSERTGFGFNCASPFSNSAQVTERSERCDEAGATCFGCKGSLFVVDFENLTDVLSLRKDLLNKRSALEAQATAKWNAEYLPLLAFSEVVFEKAKRSIHAAIFRRAVLHVDELEKQGLLPNYTW